VSEDRFHGPLEWPSMNADELRAELARREAGARAFLQVRDTLSRQLDELRRKLAEAEDDLRTFRNAGATLKAAPEDDLRTFINAGGTLKAAQEVLDKAKDRREREQKRATIQSQIEKEGLRYPTAKATP